MGALVTPPGSFRPLISPRPDTHNMRRRIDRSRPRPFCGRSTFAPIDMDGGSGGRINPYRALFHTVSGMIVLLVLVRTFPSKRLALAALLAVTLLLLAIDVLRFFTRFGGALFREQFILLASEKDRRRPNASFYYAISLLFACLLFTSRIAMGAIISLSIGDPVAKIAGRYLGRTKIRGKTLEGALANLLVCFLLIRLVVPSTLVAFCGALAGACIELVTIPKVDDNLTISLVSGMAMTVASLL